MNLEMLRVLSPGLGATIQDQGRFGWKRFGVPPAGAMDAYAADVANRLLGNPPWAPLLELCVCGARLEALTDLWLAVTGADAMATVPTWRAIPVRAGQVLSFPVNQSGLWTYVAVEGGLKAPLWLDSASVQAAAGFGRALQTGDVLGREEGERFRLPAGVGGRMAPPRDYLNPPPLRVYRGPQAEQFPQEAWEQLLTQAWTVSPTSNRAGWRLEGEALPGRPPELASEPIRLGTIQVPPQGQPIVLLNDGPTVGGYPKLGLIRQEDLSWLVQTRPGQTVRFTAAGNE